MNEKIKKKQIIIEVFGFITRAMIKDNISDSMEVKISLKEFEGYINEKLGTNINSIQHIYQQIRAYEREQRIRFFNKSHSDNKEDIVLTLARGNDYRDKFFLHIGLKMFIAKGAYELIDFLYNSSTRPLNLYLSAGSESYYFAQLLFQDTDRELNIYTHNLGIIENYINHHQHLENINFFTRFGKVSSDEMALFEQSEDNYANTDFDMIIGSTTYVDDQGLYIESENEVKIKREVFKVLRGPRILLLTLLEYNQPKNAIKHKYADVHDFDYIVIPAEKMMPKYRTRLKSFPFKSMIKYYNYEVLKNTEKGAAQIDRNQI